MRAIAYLLLMPVLVACSVPSNTESAADFDAYAEQYVRLGIGARSA